MALREFFLLDRETLGELIGASKWTIRSWEIMKAKPRLEAWGRLKETFVALAEKDGMGHKEAVTFVNQRLLPVVVRAQKEEK